MNRTLDPVTLKPKTAGRIQQLQSAADYLRHNYLDLTEAEAFAIARRLDDTARYLKREFAWKVVTMVGVVLVLVFLKE